MANLWDGNVTALHHYWLHKIVAPPSITPVWAWPCSPTILGTQGLNLYGPYTFSSRFLGGHTGGIYRGASTGDPCDHTFVDSIDGSTINPLVQVDAVPLTTNWTLECKIGWGSSWVPTSMDFIRLAGSPDVRVRFTPGMATIELRVGGSTAVSATLSLSASTFHHVALTCAAGEYKVWINGALVLSYSGAALSGVANLTLSTVFGSNRPIFLKGVRFWQDIAYTSAFTPPTSMTL